MKGCIVDRCQLYVYRALIYYIESDKPDKERANGGIGKMIIATLLHAVQNVLIAHPFPMNVKDVRR